MTTFTSSLPDNLLQLLNQKANELKVPKNKLIEKALSIYFDQLNKAEYLKSYKKMSADTDIIDLAEEGMNDYFVQLVNTETK
jgi:hypothetical protein